MDGSITFLFGVIAIIGIYALAVRLINKAYEHEIEATDRWADVSRKYARYMLTEEKRK